MDMIDILGGLLGRKSKGQGKGPDIFGDILKRGGQPEPAGRRSEAPPSDSDLSRTARELEDLLNVAKDRETRRPGPSAPQAPPRAPERRPADSRPQVESPLGPARGERSAPLPPAGRPTQNDQAQILVRAMVNAAKADGQITRDEQESILQQFGDNEAEAVRFLRAELSRPLDVREFAWSVPLGLEQQVYAMSLMAIQVDSPAESQYLQELAHALRLPTEVREQLHRRYAPATDR